MSGVLWLVEITVYDPAIPGTRVVRYANHGFVTRPSEVPASAIFDARFKTPSLLKRDCYDSKTTGGRSRIGYADLVLLNGDGLLDFFNDVAIDGRLVTIYRGAEGAAFPAGFTKYVAVMEQALVARKQVTIKMRDRALELAVPAQPTKFAGSNVLPNGLEGVAADLKGKPKPLLVGQGTNLTPRLVNSSKLIYQVHDGALHGIDAVYDAGIALGATLYVAAGGGAVSNNSTSHDAAKWGLTPVGGPGAQCSCLGAAGVLIFGNLSDVVFSTTGDSWTFHTISATFLIQGLAWNGALYVAVGDNSGVAEIWTSPDLLVWTKRTPTNFGAGTARCVAWDAINNQWVVGGDLGHVVTGNAAGTVWTSRATGFAGSIYTVTVSGTLIIIGGSNAEIRTSPTGAAWTLRASPFTGTPTIFASTFGNGAVVLGGEGGQLATSADDGVTWKPQLSRFASADAILAMIFTGTRFLIGGDNGSVATSPEATNWTLVSTGYAVGSYQIRAIAYATGLGSDVYASLVDLQDDTLAPVPGSFKAYPAGGYFRIGSSPAGVITTDATEGATAADRTHAQVFKRLLQRWGYVSGTDFSAADIVAFDALNSAVMGAYWADDINRDAILDELAGSAGAWWGPDRLNVFRFQQFAEASGAPALALTANQILSLEPTPPNDVGRGVPTWRSILRWGRNYTVQGDALAAGVTAARRAVVEVEYREAKDEDAAVQTAHLLAQEVSEDSLYVAEADAITEVQRRQGIRGVQRRVYSAVVELDDDVAAADLFDVAQLVYPRFGLSGGQLFRILGADPAPAKKQATLTLWG